MGASDDCKKGKEQEWFDVVKSNALVDKIAVVVPSGHTGPASLAMGGSKRSHQLARLAFTQRLSLAFFIDVPVIPDRSWG